MRLTEIPTQIQIQADGDFSIEYYLQFEGLFLATGDSNHSFKTFPIVDEKVVDSIEGNLESEIQEL